MGDLSYNYRLNLLSIIFGVSVGINPSFAHSNTVAQNLKGLNSNYNSSLSVNSSYPLTDQIIDLRKQNRVSFYSKNRNNGYVLSRTQHANLDQKLKIENEGENNIYLNYQVKKGDNLSSIGRRFNLNWEEIAKVNKIYSSNDYRIYIGQILNLNLDKTQFAKKKNVKTAYSDFKSTSSSKDYEFKFSDIKLTDLKIMSSEKCHSVKVKVLNSKPITYIAKEANLGINEILTQTGMTANKIIPGIYNLCVKKDIDTGLIPLHYEYNKALVLKASGDDVWKARKKFGPFGFSRFLGSEPGNCFPERAERKEMVERFNPFFNEVASKSKYVTADLLKSLTLVESGGNPFCVSKKGAIGLKQLVGENYSLDAYRELKLRNLRKANVKITKEKIDKIKQSKNYETSVNPINPQDSIARGGELLDKLLEKYKDKTLALTAYNQGEARVDAAISVAAKHGVTKPAQIVRYMSKEARLFAATVIFEGERNGYNPKG